MKGYMPNTESLTVVFRGQDEMSFRVIDPNDQSYKDSLVQRLTHLTTLQEGTVSWEESKPRHVRFEIPILPNQQTGTVWDINYPDMPEAERRKLVNFAVFSTLNELKSLGLEKKANALIEKSRSQKAA